MTEPSFAELAVEVALAARREVFGIEAVEAMHAHEPNAAIARTLVELRRTAGLLGEAHRLLKALIPHEAHVRTLIEEKSACAMPTLPGPRNASTR